MKFLIIILLLTGCSKDYPSSIICEQKIVIEGDSYSTANKWPLFLKDSSDYFKNIEQVNYAKSGEQAYQMKNQYSTQAHLSRPAKVDEYWFFIYAGINDLAGANRSADTVYAALKSIWENAKNDGYRVVAFTVIHSLTLNAGKEAQRVKLNNMILGNKKLYDHVIDMAKHFDPRTQPELFIDGTHLTTAGYRIFAGVVARELQPYTCRPVFLP